MKELELIKELRNKVLTQIIEESGSLPGDDLTDTKINLYSIKGIIYSEAKKIVNRIVEEEF